MLIKGGDQHYNVHTRKDKPSIKANVWHSKATLNQADSVMVLWTDGAVSVGWISMHVCHMYEGRLYKTPPRAHYATVDAVCSEQLLLQWLLNSACVRREHMRLGDILPLGLQWYVDFHQCLVHAGKKHDYARLQHVYPESASQTATQSATYSSYGSRSTLTYMCNTHQLYAQRRSIPALIKERTACSVSYI